MTQPLAIDVILRTHNRRDLLPAAVESVFAADSRGIDWRLLVVDNASTDDTPAFLNDLRSQHDGRLVCLHEPRPGGQHALNCGLRHAKADIVAFFDDDERIEAGWFQAIRREFADSEIDFIAGPVLPAGVEDFPDWLPEGFGGVLGIIDHGNDRSAYGEGFPGMLTQGNCALRRRLFSQTGLYPSELPTAEDLWLWQRLRALGKTGVYCPDFVVRHVMQQERITRRYFRKWAVRQGRDLAVCDKLAGARPLILAPWYWRQIAGCSARWTFGRGSPAERFRDELNLRIAAVYARTQFREWLGLNPA